MCASGHHSAFTPAIHLAISPVSAALKIAQSSHIEVICSELGHENHDRRSVHRLCVFSRKVRVVPFSSLVWLSYWSIIPAGRDYCEPISVPIRLIPGRLQDSFRWYFWDGFKKLRFHAIVLSILPLRPGSKLDPATMKKVSYDYLSIQKVSIQIGIVPSPILDQFEYGNSLFQSDWSASCWMMCHFDVSERSDRVRLLWADLIWRVRVALALQSSQSKERPE
jgi:hypothetical protein